MKNLKRSVRRDAPVLPPLSGGRPGEKGSALLISILVMVILTLLGISYLMLAQTESQIAENQLNAQQALFVAEAGARMVVNWFNDPSSTGYKVPTPAQVNRAIRWYDHDANPSTANVLGVAGDATRPIYREGTDDLFDKPYRMNSYLSFLGEESHAGTDEGPDVRIDAAAGGAQAAFLADLNDTLFHEGPIFPRYTHSQIGVTVAIEIPHQRNLIADAEPILPLLASQETRAVGDRHIDVTPVRVQGCVTNK